MNSFMSNANDETLAEKFRDHGDREALILLVQRYERPVYSFFLRYLEDDHEAEEAAQECFLRMLRGFSGYRSGLPFRPWLYRIALNTGRSLVSRKQEQTRRERAASLNGPAEATHMNPAEAAFHKEIQDLVEGLPQAQREALDLHYYQGLTHSEVASVLDVPSGTVAWRIHVGIESLRARLSAQGAMIAAVPLELSLRASQAAKAPASILSAVLREASGTVAYKAGAAVALQGGSVVAKTKLSMTTAIAALCVGAGALGGYWARSVQDPVDAPMVSDKRTAGRLAVIGAGQPPERQHGAESVATADARGETTLNSAKAVINESERLIGAIEAEKRRQKLAFAKRAFEAYLAAYGADVHPERQLELHKMADELDEEMTSYFIDRYREEGDPAARWVALCLGIGAGGPKAAEFLEGWLNDPATPADKRSGILQALCGLFGDHLTLGNVSVGEALGATALRLTESVSVGDRMGAAYLLGNYHQPDSPVALKRLADQDPDPMVRAVAIRSLGKVGDQVTLAYLQTYPVPSVDDGGWYIKVSLQESLKELGIKFPR